MEGVPVASVGNLETYGLLTGIDGEAQRNDALDVFGRMYSPAIGSGAVMDYIHATALTRSRAPTSWPPRRICILQRRVLRHRRRPVHEEHRPDPPGNFGTRILYTTSPYNGFDSHANQAQANAALWTDVSNTVDTFFTDLRDHDASDNVTLFLFSEFAAASPTTAPAPTTAQPA